VQDNEGNGPKPLNENQRNSLLMRTGEKNVLKYLIETTDLILPLLDKNLQEVKKLVKTMKLKDD
jgi:hypothetical protein